MKMKSVVAIVMLAVVASSGAASAQNEFTRSDTRSTGGEGFVIGEGFDVAWIIADDEYDE